MSKSCRVNPFFVALAALSVAGTAQAEDWSTTFSGFIRSETAVSATGDSNVFNQNGNLFNGKEVVRISPLFTDTATRDGVSQDQWLNLQHLRGELNMKTRFGDHWSFNGRLRAIFDPIWYREYDPARIGSMTTAQNYAEPNYFRYYTPGNSRPNPLEWSGRNYMIDLPAFFLEYDRGPLNLRLGNQQIAWGQALFFRVLDVPDGLDFRRHSILDYVPEEYSDKRVPALGARLTYQLNDSWLLDSYVQKFQPTIYGNVNTPYQVIPSQFSIRDTYAQVDHKFDLGLRLKGEIGNLGLQFVAAHRRNPDGVFAWTESGVNRDIPGMPGSGQVLACTPFEVDPSGVWSASEWFTYAAMARLDGLAGLNNAVNQFACSGLLGAVPAPDMDFARLELDQFFQLAGGLAQGVPGRGGLRGWLSRKYVSENNIGGGLSYAFSGAPGSLFDQMILNWEVMYTPNRTFTSPDLSVNHLRTSEWSTAITLENGYRFSDTMPATYLIAEFMYKSKSDLFGRYLGGMGGDPLHTPRGADSFKALTFAIQQPSKDLVWRFDLALLYDLEGGVLIQPAVRWKPNRGWTVEAFYNYINSHLGGNPNKNIFGGLDHAKELTIRAAYQF